MIKFTKEHEWAKKEGETITVGITNFAQHALGDVVYVEVPKIGRVVKKGEAVAVVESVKAASDIYAPVSGTITEVNTALADEPALVNTSPVDKGWFFKLKPDGAEFDALLDESAYQAHVKALG